MVIILAWLPSILDVTNSDRVSNFSFIRVIRILKVLSIIINYYTFYHLNFNNIKYFILGFKNS